MGVNGIVNAGPQEFLGWIKNAAVVVTDSFHGSVLSVNMRKPFLHNSRANYMSN